MSCPKCGLPLGEAVVMGAAKHVCPEPEDVVMVEPEPEPVPEDDDE